MCGGGRFRVKGSRESRSTAPGVRVGTYSLLGSFSSSASSFESRALQNPDEMRILEVSCWGPTFVIPFIARPCPQGPVSGSMLVQGSVVVNRGIDCNSTPRMSKVTSSSDPYRRSSYRALFYPPC